MKSLKLPVAVPHRQMSLVFDNSRLEGLVPAEREKVTVALAQVLMQAVGLEVEELDDDKH